MIAYNSKNWFRHIFLFHKSDALRILMPEIILLAAYTWGLIYAEHNWFENMDMFQNTITIHSLIGFVLGLLLVFRTNTAYDRWWEGRKKWGALVNDSRNLAMKINAILPASDKENRAFFATMIPNYVYAMKEHLREGVNMDEIEDLNGLKEALKNIDHKPNYIAKMLFSRAKKLNREGILSNEDLLIIDKELKGFSDILGACERIKNTPIPFSYSLFIKKVIFIYVLTIPIGFIPVFGYGTIPIACFIFYVLVGIEIIAEEIEDPFGRDSNDLPTDTLSEKIKANVNEILMVE
jgi:putative membrane protein